MKTNHMFLSLKERQEMPFIMYGDEKGKVKMVDLDKAVKIMLDKRDKDATSVVEIRPISVDRYKEKKKSLTFSRDKVTGIFYGIPIGLHIDGNVKWKKVPLGDVNIFDLRNFEEAKMWFIARMNPIVKGSPFVDTSIEPEFEVYDPDAEALDVIYHANQVTKALNRAKTMKRNDVLNFARYLGVIIPQEYNSNLIRAEIIKMASINPIEFNKKFDDENRKLAEIFYSGVVTGIIVQSHEHGFVFRGVQLGLSDPEAIAFLRRDTITLQSLISAIKELDAAFGATIDDLDEEETDENNNN